MNRISIATGGLMCGLVMVSCNPRPAHEFRFAAFREKTQGEYDLAKWSFDEGANYFILFSGDITSASIVGREIKVRIKGGGETLEASYDSDAFFRCNWARLTGDPSDHYNNYAVALKFAGDHAYNSFSSPINDAKVELVVSPPTVAKRIYLMERKSN